MWAFYRLVSRPARLAAPLRSVGVTTALPLSGQDIENAVVLEGVPADPSGKEVPVAGPARSEPRLSRRRSAFRCAADVPSQSGDREGTPRSPS